MARTLLYLSILLMLIVVFFASCGGTELGNTSSTNNDSSINDSFNDNSVSGEDESLPCKGAERLKVSDFLWKPVSESDGKLVILFDDKFSDEFESVEVIVAGTSVYEAGVFSGRTNEGRLTYRFTLEGKDYTGEVIVTVKGVSCSAVVPDPSNRSE